MSDGDAGPAPRWPRGFDEHTRAQRRRLAELPMAEKLRWLEEAHELVRSLQQGKGAAGGE